MAEYVKHVISNSTLVVGVTAYFYYVHMYPEEEKNKDPNDKNELRDIDRFLSGPAPEVDPEVALKERLEARRRLKTNDYVDPFSDKVTLFGRPLSSYYLFDFRPGKSSDN